jgi:hypothetical protein
MGRQVDLNNDLVKKSIRFYLNLRHILQRESPKALSTTFIRKLIKGTVVIPLPNGNKDKDITMDNPQFTT